MSEWHVRAYTLNLVAALDRTSVALTGSGDCSCRGCNSDGLRDRVVGDGGRKDRETEEEITESDMNTVEHRGEHFKRLESWLVVRYCFVGRSSWRPALPAGSLLILPIRLHYTDHYGCRNTIGASPN